VRTYEKHQLKQDKFVETTKGTIFWAVENRSKLVTLGIAIGVLIVALIGGSWLWNYRSEKASGALGAAMETYNAPVIAANAPPQSEMVSFPSVQDRARAARSQFQKVADQYGLTKPGRVARYMAAVTALDMSDNQTAEKELMTVADSGNKDLASLAKLALAGLYRETNRTNDALQLYKQLIDRPTETVSKATAQLELAALFENNNQGSEAGKLYSEVIKDDPRSAAAALANERLSTLK
jgi:predicted negative regulator of RcsB-dependent stress response